jgi:hypothetical protein
VLHGSCVRSRHATTPRAVRVGAREAHPSLLMSVRRVGAVEESGWANVTVPYRENRLVMFDSALFHKTDSFAFKPGFLVPSPPVSHISHVICITQVSGFLPCHQGSVACPSASQVVAESLRRCIPLLLLSAESQNQPHASLWEHGARSRASKNNLSCRVEPNIATSQSRARRPA